MPENKKPNKNLHQILVVLCSVLTVFYGYSFYIAVRLHDKPKTIFNGCIAIAWLLCGIIWFLQLRKINRREKENDSSE